ncbi:MAG TPA: DUF6804 family protein [Terrimesophilobacter sp.]|jgi:hypothetical protein|uniref:DUF6804 family protein n=1 Tax=Terrimesophilobacter sp. TaxID=2906435 RepID=UPI002F93662E
MTSYPTPAFTRPALAPGLLGAIVLFVGLALLDNDSAYFWIKAVVAVLALILCVFAWQAKQWWWLLGLVPIAIVWNPVWPIDLHGQGWVAAQFVAALVFIVAGVLIKVRNQDDRNRR